MAEKCPDLLFLRDGISSFIYFPVSCMILKLVNFAISVSVTVYFIHVDTSECSITLENISSLYQGPPPGKRTVWLGAQLCDAGEGGGNHS